MVLVPYSAPRLRAEALHERHRADGVLLFDPGRYIGGAAMLHRLRALGWESYDVDDDAHDRPRRLFLLRLAED